MRNALFPNILIFKFDKLEILNQRLFPVLNEMEIVVNDNETGLCFKQRIQNSIRLNHLFDEHLKVSDQKSIPASRSSGTGRTSIFD